MSAPGVARQRVRRQRHESGADKEKKTPLHQYAQAPPVRGRCASIGHGPETLPSTIVACRAGRTSQVCVRRDAAGAVLVVPGRPCFVAADPGGGVPYRQHQRLTDYLAAYRNPDTAVGGDRVVARAEGRLEITQDGDGGELRVRGAPHLRCEKISGALSPWTPRTLRRVIGREGDPAAFISIRPWIRTGRCQLWVDESGGADTVLGGFEPAIHAPSWSRRSSRDLTGSTEHGYACGDDRRRPARPPALRRQGGTGSRVPAAASAWRSPPGIVVGGAAVRGDHRAQARAPSGRVELARRGPDVAICRVAGRADESTSTKSRRSTRGSKKEYGRPGRARQQRRHQPGLRATSWRSTRAPPARSWTSMLMLGCKAVLDPVRKGRAASDADGHGGRSINIALVRRSPGHAAPGDRVLRGQQVGPDRADEGAAGRRARAGRCG